MPLVRLFALGFGAIYLLVGLVGFVPPLLGENLQGVMGPFAGLLLGIFAVNWFHNVAHLLIGIAGLAVYRSFAGSKAYALILGVAYTALFLLGIVSGDVGTLGGLLPLNAPDDVLHLLTALVAFGAYFTARAPEQRTATRGA